MSTRDMEPEMATHFSPMLPASARPATLRPSCFGKSPIQCMLPDSMSTCDTDPEMVPHFSPMLPVSAKPTFLRPSCLDECAKEEDLWKASRKTSGRKPTPLETDLRNALSSIFKSQTSSAGGLSEVSTEAPSEVSTMPSSGMSTMPSSESPSRRDSQARCSMEEYFSSAPTSELTDMTDLCNKIRCSSAGVSEVAQPVIGGVKRSPKTPTRLRERINAAREQAKENIPIRPWHGAHAARSRELSLPCAEVGYWSVWKLGMTENGKLANPQTEQVRRAAREKLRSKPK